MIAGARYDIDLRRPVGDRIRNLSCGAARSARTDSFTLAVNSHRQTGAGGYAMLRGAPVVYDKGREHSRPADRGGPEPEPIDPAGYARRRVAHRARGRAAPFAACSAFPRARCRRAARTPSSSGSSPPPIFMARCCLTSGAGYFERGAAALAATLDSLAADCACPSSGSTPATRCRARRLRTSPGAAPVEVLNRLGFAADRARRTRLRVVASTRCGGACRRRDIAGSRRMCFDSRHRPAARLDRAVPVLDVGRTEGRRGRLHYCRDQDQREGGADRRTSLRRGRAGHPRRAGRGPRAAAADLTVLLAHAGGSCDRLGLHRRDRSGWPMRSSRATLDLHRRGAHAPDGQHQGRGDPDRRARAGGERASAVADLVKTPPGPGGRDPDRAGQRRPSPAGSRRWRRWSRSTARRDRLDHQPGGRHDQASRSAARASSTGSAA